MDPERLIELNNNSAYSRLLGMKIEIPAPGWSKASLLVDEHLLNFMGKPHGGAIFSLADQAFAAACNSMGRPAVALQMSINFISSPSVGDTITAEAKTKHVGRSIGVFHLDVHDQEGNLIATCNALAYYLKK